MSFVALRPHLALRYDGGPAVPNDDDLGSAPTGVGPTPQPSDGSVSSRDSRPLGQDGGTPSLIADRYEVLGLLGMGGMGRVYRAHDRSLDEIVALKILRRELLDLPGVLERFRQEVKLARRVTSTHVVRTFDLGQHGDDHFLTMEYLEGCSLAHLLDGAPLAISEVLRIARAACAGVAAAHLAGVLHRDLKPDNVLVAATGRIAITDFGIAHLNTNPTATADRFAGTPAYMAPEQVEGSAVIGPAADVYAFGAMLFEMVAGRRPFVGSDPFAVALARLREAPPDPRTLRAVPDVLAELVIRCLARDPAARYADAGAVGRALANIEEQPAATSMGRPRSRDIPTKTSRTVALLPLRAVPDLAEIAEGLSEEIVDTLSMTRALRVRPLAAVRRANRPDLEPREIGKTLGVDVIVDGSLRRVGDTVRISARVTGVADGFQLWANRFDTGPEGLLAAGDVVARAIARALTVEIDVPMRGPTDPRATELYLEAKAKLRLGWNFGQVFPAIDQLEQAIRLAPDEPSIIATLALAFARAAHYGAMELIPRARKLAELAIELAPGAGEPWLALGLAELYSGAIAAGARALVHAVARAPGLVLAQAALGGLLTEAGALDDGITHLEGALALDPAGPQGYDLVRGRVYAGHAKTSDQIAKLVHDTCGMGFYSEFTIGRLRLWRGETRPILEAPPPDLPGDLMEYAVFIIRAYSTGRLDDADRETMRKVVNVTSPRLRAARSQFIAELLMFAGDPPAALEYVELGVGAGLQDYLWIERCPLLEPLRGTARFDELAAIVRERATTVLAAVEAARQAS